MVQKEKVVKGLTGGIEHLFKKYNVEYIKGHGAFLDPHSLSVNLTAGGDKSFSFKNAIFATGSHPNNLPRGILPIDEKVVLSSTGKFHILLKVLYHLRQYLRKW